MITEDRKHILRQLVRGYEDGKLLQTFYGAVGANVDQVIIEWKGSDRPKLKFADLQVLEKEGFVFLQVTKRNKREGISTVQCTLRERAFEAVRSDFSPPESTTSTRYDIGAIILTALPVEYQAVRAHLTDLREEVHPQGTIYERGKFSSGDRSWKIGIVEIGPGNPGAAMEAERAINHFNPRVAFFVGVAGGIKDVALGDVVAATKVYGYESGKATSVFQTRPDVVNSTYRMIERAKFEARKEDWLRRLEGSVSDPKPNVFVGPIAAGEKVVASTRSAVWKFLRSSYNDALAVEMEGHGFLKAIHANPQVDALVVRGISDLIEGKSETDAAGYQAIAARHASAFVFEILAKLAGVEVGGAEHVGLDSLRTLHGLLPAEAVRMRPDRSPFQVIRDIPHFVGREKELEGLRKVLLASQHVTIYSLEGLGGVGKTALAVHVAYQLHPYFPDGVLWARLDTSDTRSILVSFAEAYGHNVSRYEDLESLSRVVREILSRKRALILLDNARSSEEVIPLLPPTGTCAVIVTTRRRDLSVTRGARRFYIGAFDKEKQEALALFAKVLGEERSQKERRALAEIADFLGHLPLAIDIAASRLAHEPSWPVLDFLERLQHEKRRLDELRYEDLSVRASFNVSFDALTPDQQEFFASLGAFPGEEFSIEAAAHITEMSYEKAQGNIRKLYGLSLVQQGSLDHYYRLHPLLRIYAKERITDPSVFDRMEAFFVLHLDSAISKAASLLQDGDIVPFDISMLTDMENLFKEATTPRLRAAIHLLRYTALLSTGEQSRALLEDRSFRTEFARTLREVGQGLYSKGHLRAFEAIGKLIALQYHAIDQDEGTEIDRVTLDAKIATFLKRAAKAVYEEDPGPPLRALRTLLLDVKQLNPEGEGAIPILALSWSRLIILELFDWPVSSDSFLWANKYEQAAFLILKMAEAFERRQLSRIVELISKSYDPGRHVLKLTVHRHFRALSANAHD